MGFALRLEVGGGGFETCFREPVDGGVGAGGDEEFADEGGALEGYLPRGHAVVFAQVGPGGVEDGDVVFFVACGVSRGGGGGGEGGGGGGGGGG